MLIALVHFWDRPTPHEDLLLISNDLGLIPVIGNSYPYFTPCWEVLQHIKGRLR